jgi:hypothetical protein
VCSAVNDYVSGRGTAVLIPLPGTTTSIQFCPETSGASLQGQLQFYVVSQLRTSDKETNATRQPGIAQSLRISIAPPTVFSNITVLGQRVGGVFEVQTVTDSVAAAAASNVVIAFASTGSLDVFTASGE